jgi:hypothetical protein
MTSWTYTAPIVASWARARSHGARRYTAPAHREAVACHRLHALAARPDGWRTDGVYRVEIVYYSPDMRRRDCDRVASLVLDALVGVAYDDDSDRYLAGHTCDSARALIACGRIDEQHIDLSCGHTYVRVTRLGDAPQTVARRRRARTR